MNISYFKVSIILSLLFLNINAFSQSANKLRKIGNEFEKRNAFQKASDYYLQALEKRSKDQNSIKGLKRSAPKYIEKLSKRLNEEFQNKKYKVVLNEFKNVKDYQSKIAKYGVSINLPRNLYEINSQSEEYFAEKYYSKAKLDFDNGLFDASIKNFNECLKYKNPYKDVFTILSKAKDSKDLIEAEKHYYNGVSKMDKKNFRGAYHDFKKCISIKRYYKDAYSLKEEALKKGLAKVGVFNVLNSSNYRRGIENTLYSKIISSIEQKRSPFIHIVEHKRIKQLYGNYNTKFNESNAARIGREIGLEFVVIARLINVEKSGTTPKGKPVEAFERYYVKTSDGKSIPKGRKVKFNLYEGSSSVNFKIKYQIISTKNNLVVESGILSESASDKVKYATYRGDYKKLCVTDPGKNGSGLLGSLLTNVTMVNQKLFTARKDLKSPYDLHKPVFERVARKIATEVYNEIQ